MPSTAVERGIRRRRRPAVWATNLYAAFKVATGEVLGRVTCRHRAREFRQFLAQIDRATPPDLALHLVVDNSSTHTTDAIRDVLAAHPRFHLHVTPTSAALLSVTSRIPAPLLPMPERGSLTVIVPI